MTRKKDKKIKSEQGGGQQTSNINWFPGHMTKARRQMEENLKKVDFIIEIRDARIPLASKNPMLDELIGTKPRLIILSKKDKADPVKTKEWLEYFQTDRQKAVALDLIVFPFLMFCLAHFYLTWEVYHSINITILCNM